MKRLLFAFLLCGVFESCFCQDVKGFVMQQYEEWFSSRDSIFSFGCIKNEELSYSDNHFVYDNVAYEDSLLFSFLYENTTNSKFVSLPGNDIYLTGIPMIKKVPSAIFRSLAQFNCVNLWSKEEYYIEHGLAPAFPSKEYTIDFIVNEYDCYFCGQVLLSPYFNSFLFLKQSVDGESVVKELYIMNCKEDTITSICCFNGLSLDGEVSYEYTCIDDGWFYYRYEFLPDDNIVTNSSSEVEKDEYVFTFDNNGRVISLHKQKYKPVEKIRIK